MSTAIVWGFLVVIGGAIGGFVGIWSTLWVADIATNKEKSAELYPWDPMYRAAKEAEQQRRTMIATYMRAGMSRDVAVKVADDELARRSAAARKAYEEAEAVAGGGPR